jgi:hypothetical protein
MRGMSERVVYVVPHTHWDREWYQPHELFRWRLVQMIDELLLHMEGHAEYRCFNLDGQSIVIEDYLQLRPENEGRLRTLIEAGRIVIGPWWVQPDEFLPTGESHIRNFQRGIRFAKRLGGSLMVGHCADQFGHIAQMPQIMRGLGMTSACLWRGVPDTVPGWSFQWEAPDGTRLPVLYLRNSYSSGWRLPKEPDELAERTRREAEARRDGEPLLLMNGTDHSRMEKQVPAALDGGRGRGFDYRLATLAEYERAMLAAGMDEFVHHGELRSPDNSNVLVGVLSARMNLKQRDFRVQSALERVAEPLEVLAHLAAGYDGLPALEQAWRLMLENAPHDSICGCSVDQTHREMLPRYDRAEQLAEEVAREAVTAVLGSSGAGGEGVAVFRTVPHAPAVVETTVPAEWKGEWLVNGAGNRVRVALGPAGPSELLQRNETTPAGALRHLDFLREGRYADQRIEEIRCWTGGTRLFVETLVGPGIHVGAEDATREGVRESVRAGGLESAVVAVRRRARRTLRAVLPPAEAIGLETWQLEAKGEAQAPAARAGGGSIENEFYRVRLGRAGLDVEDLRNGRALQGINQFVDQGDRGDEYNAEILSDGVVIPGEQELLALEADGVLARLRYRAILRVPVGLTRDRRRRQGRSVTTAVETEVVLWAGVPWVEFRVSLENAARDHRLRAWFPLGFETDEAITEGHFHVERRPLTPPPWNGRGAEQPPTTFPQKSFAAFEAGGYGLAVMNRGLPEGEAVRWRGRQAYALTLLRCVGWLSRDDLQSRKGHAGPLIATRESQMAGKHEFSYALATYRGGWQEAGVLPLAHGFAHAPVAFATNAAAPAAWPVATFAEAVLVPSAIHRSAADARPVLRAWNAGAVPVKAGLGMPAVRGVARRVDLMEQPMVGTTLDAEEMLRERLRGWEIGTWAFEPEPTR